MLDRADWIFATLLIGALGALVAAIIGGAIGAGAVIWWML